MSTASAIANPVTIYMSILRDEKSSNVSLKNAFGAFINSLSNRIQSENINIISEELKEMMFDLRLDFITWLSEEDIDTKRHFELINERITGIDYDKNHIALHEVIQKNLNSFQKIATSIFVKEGVENFHKAQDEIQNDRLNYTMFRFLQSHPHPQVKYLKKWIDESLRFDIALTTAILIIEKEIHIEQKRIQQELIPFLNKTINRFGAYSIFTAFWKPDKNDYSPETYKIQILADIIRINNGIQPLFLKIEKHQEDIDFMWEITPYVNTHGFLRELTRFIVTDGGNRKKIIRYGIYNNWNNIQETLLLLNDKRAVNAIHEAHENHKNGILNKGKTIEEIFTDV